MLAILVIFSIPWLTGFPSNTSANTDYLSTGLGQNEREAHPEYSLKLMFSIRSGKYLAAVDVDIYQDGRKIKSIHSSGPWKFRKILASGNQLRNVPGQFRYGPCCFTIGPDAKRVVALDVKKVGNAVEYGGNI